MNSPVRTFEAKPAIREAVPLLVGLTGASGCGKTFSALRLASGIQSVTGGDIYGTRGYSAPEAGEGPTVASDLYTIGRTLAVLLMEFRFQSVYEFDLPPPVVLAPPPFCAPLAPARLRHTGPRIIYIGHQPTVEGPRVIYGTD